MTNEFSGAWKEVSILNEVLFGNLSGRTEEKDEKSQSGELVSRPKL
jgi:hypothetical protein